MSRNYDNWERLVAAVIKRQQIWELCHQHSRSPSICSEASSILSDFSSTTTEIQIRAEWTEQYEPGVHITIVNLPDGTRDLKRVLFSRRIFEEDQAGIWWLKNREKIYKKYNVLASDKSSVSGQAARRSEVALPSEASSSDFSSMKIEIQIHEAAWIEQYEPGVYITIVALRDGTRDLKRIRFSRRKFGEHQAETWMFDNIEKVYEKYNVPIWDKSWVSGQAARSSEGALPCEEELTELYEPGVYMILSALQDGTRDLKRIRFSRKIFREHQVEAWWSDNREKVYEKYNVRRSDKCLSVFGLSARSSIGAFSPPYKT